MFKIILGMFIGGAVVLIIMSLSILNGDISRWEENNEKKKL